MGRERERRGRLRPERGGRHPRRPRIARRARPRRPLPRRAPRREPGGRVDRPSRVPDLRHARRAPLGHDRAPRRRVRVPHVRLRRAERRAPLVAPVGDAARRSVRGAAARPRRRPGRARDLRDRPGRRGRLAGRPFRRRRRGRARGRPARAAELRGLDLRARSRDRPDGGLSPGERIGAPAARGPSHRGGRAGDGRWRTGARTGTSWTTPVDPGPDRTLSSCRARRCREGANGGERSQPTRRVGSFGLVRVRGRIIGP